MEGTCADVLDELIAQVAGFMGALSVMVRRSSLGPDARYDPRLPHLSELSMWVDVLADTEGEACEAFGVWQEKERHGERRMGIVRSTFIVDKEGVVRHALYDIKPKGHATQILELVRSL